MPFGIGLPEIIIFLIVVLLLFGAKRVPEIGRSVGKGMREFKDAVTGQGRRAAAAAAGGARGRGARRVASPPRERDSVS